MADFAATIRTLEQQRQQLLEQLSAVDRAIAALKGTDRPGRWMPPDRVEPPPAQTGKRARKKREFKLSDEHKQKLLEGQRRAREARRAGGTASDAGVPAIMGWKGDAPPRLVKREPGS